MKKSVNLFLLILIIGLFPIISNSQVSVGVNINVPVVERYYYLQDIEGYYDTKTSMYIYNSGGRWVRVRTLPVIYRGFDFNTAHKVIIRDYSGNSPYYYYKVHRANFPKGKYLGKEKSYWSYKEYKSRGVKVKNSNKGNSKNIIRSGKSTGNMRSPGNNGNQGNKGNKGNKGRKGK